MDLIWPEKSSSPHLYINSSCEIQRKAWKKVQPYTNPHKQPCQIFQIWGMLKTNKIMS